MKVPERVHLIGIGGTGMSSIARVLMEQGKSITGSDLVASETVEQLQGLGATVHIGHDANNVNGAGLVVTSTAIAGTNPEIIAAQKRGIPIAHRSQMWAHILNSGQGIAVAGAHGKTTITAMIAWTLHQAGVDPTFLIGGEIANLGGGRSGKGNIVVAEADESDGSFLRYRPWCTVLTSVEADHLEHYDGDFSRLIAAYDEFLGHIDADGVAVLCSDEAAVMELGQKVSARKITYGFEAPADFTADKIQYDGFTTRCEVSYQGKRLGEIELQIPGRHNIQNALAVIAVCLEVGVSWPEIAEHLSSFSGARRRFEVVGASNGVLVIDDYAHHPSEVRATLSATRSGWPEKRVIAVFQPHRYARTHFLFQEFETAFLDADHVIVTAVFAPSSEQPIPGASGDLLADRVRARCNAKTKVEFIQDLTLLPKHLVKVVQSGDIVVTMGAGNIWEAAREFAHLMGKPT